MHRPAPTDPTPPTRVLASAEPATVRLVLSPADYALLGTLPLPVRTDGDGTLTLHISGWLMLRNAMAAPPVFDDAKARAAVADYLAECARTAGGPGFTAPRHRPEYDWALVLSQNWKPCRYQSAAMEAVWHRAERFDSGTVLADDVGLGKTVVSIGLCCRLAFAGRLDPSRPAVVVCPSSLKGQWRDEFERFAGTISPSAVVSVHGSRSERLARLAAPASVYVLSWEMLHLPQYAAAVAAVAARCCAVVFDESHRIKNPDSVTIKAARRLFSRVPLRLLLNATPIENGLLDFFAQAKLVDDRALGSARQFCDRYVTFDFWGRPIRYRNVPEFRRRAACLFLRRVARDVAAELPAVRASIRPVELSPEQTAAYLARCAEFTADTSTGAIAVAGLAKVQAAALLADPANFHSASAKLDDLESLLAGELAHERFVVFTRFKTLANAAAARLSKYRPQLITGDTSDRDRQAVARRFSDASGAGRLLIGTEAMDRGLNLQGAGVVCNLDLPWTVARLRQRVGRCARRGQTRASVLVINWRAVLPDGRPTIDDWFLRQILPAKRDLAESVFGSDGVDEIGLDPDAVDVASARAFLSGAPSAPPVADAIRPKAKAKRPARFAVTGLPSFRVRRP